MTEPIYNVERKDGKDENDSSETVEGHGVGRRDDAPSKSEGDARLKTHRLIGTAWIQNNHHRALRVLAAQNGVALSTMVARLVETHPDLLAVLQT